MDPFLVFDDFNLHTGKVSPDATSSGSHYCHNLFNSSIGHNMFFLPCNLEKEKNKSRKCQKLPTKPRAKILEEHFPCNSSIFHDMDTFWILYYNVALYMATSMSRLIPVTPFFFIKFLYYSNSFVNFVTYIIRFPSYREAWFSLCRFSVQ